MVQAGGKTQAEIGKRVVEIGSGPAVESGHAAGEEEAAAHSDDGIRAEIDDGIVEELRAEAQVVRAFHPAQIHRFIEQIVANFLRVGRIGIAD